MTYTALVKQTNEALMETMTETLREAIELNKADAHAAADTDYKELVLSL